MFIKDNIYGEDGALWLRSTAIGDEKDRVVVNSEGIPTYLAADIAYHRDKYERRFDLLLDIWGADHHGYIPRMRAVVDALGYTQESFKVLLYQFVTLTRDNVEVSMSKRSGEYVALREVIDEVGKDASRYNFLMRTGDSHLEFDLELAKRQSNENPVYYLQYAHARISSILGKAALNNFKIPAMGEADLSLLDIPAEREIIKELVRLPEVIESAAKKYEPHRITNYVYNLASLFHSYYNVNRVLNDDSKLSGARLYFVVQIRTVIKICLGLLGVDAPESMSQQPA